MPAERYHFSYAEDTPYGHAVRLLADHTFVDGGVLLDIGCGYGAIAEPAADLGLAYVGVDLEPAGVEDLRRRGFEGDVVDLADAAGLRPRLAALLHGRPLAAICALDILEHLTNGPAVLGALRSLAIDEGRAPLVVSIPNVAHLDLAAKLLVGRWDVTPTGLLDETHVALYAPARLEAAFAAAGWAEVGEADFELVESDQHFPSGAPVLAPTPLHDLLAGLRRRAAPGATTNQFVRAYAPAAALPPAEAGGTRPAPFLSALVVDGGDDERLVDTLVALDAQPAGDVEVVCCTLDARLSRRAGLEALLASFPGLAVEGRVVALPAGTGAAARAALLDAAVAGARGRYVTVLDDGAVPFAHYLETFSRLADERPGAVVRSLALSQALRPVSWPGHGGGYEPAEGAVVASAPAFDLLAHVRDGGSPPGSYAVPTDCFDVLGMGFAGGAPGLEDDEVLARAAMWCGLHEDASTAVLLARRPPGGLAPADRSALLAALDGEPLLFPAGTLSRLVSPPEAEADPAAAPLVAAMAPAEPAEPAETAQEAETGREVAELVAELAAAEAEIAALRASTSWRVTAPLRRLSPRRSGS